MLADLTIGFWAFWLAAGIVLYVVFAWTTIRLAARWNDRHPHDPPASHSSPSHQKEERSDP